MDTRHPQEVHSAGQPNVHVALVQPTEHATSDRYQHFEGHQHHSPEIAAMSMSDSIGLDSLPLTPLHDDPFMTPVDGISEVMLDDLLRRSHGFKTPPGLQNQKQTQIGTAPRLIQQQQNQKLFEPETPSSILTQNSSDESVQTDASVANHTAVGETGLSPHAVIATPRGASTAAKREASCLVTFQRTIDKEHLVQTTLHAKADGPTEDTMADLVRRLQKSTTGSAVLTFAKKDLKKVSKGKRQILFHMPQVHKTLSFSKDEFGPMKISELMKLTPERPIVVEINLERTISGDQIDIF